MFLKSLKTTYVLQYYSRLSMVVNDSIGAKQLKTVSFGTEEDLMDYIDKIQKDSLFVSIKSIKCTEDLELG